jgi:RNA polymerase sigma factor (sigma-70 family)
MAQGQLARVLDYLHRLAGPAEAGSDGQVLARFVTQRDESAFATLLERHGLLVWNVCRRILGDPHAAEDAFQATFLVLLRKAGSLRLRGSLAGWLHAVAHRTALRARAQSQRWRAGKEMPDVTQPEAPAADAEVRQLVQEELAGLPEKYRAPLVLCFLEGKTHEEAARELGWPRGSMAKRLERGQELLRTRLAHRGVTLASTALFTAFAAEASASLPSSLSAATLHAAAGTLAGAAGAGFSNSITTLAEGVLAEMFRTKIKIAVSVCVGLAIAGIGTGLLAPKLIGVKSNGTPVAAAPVPAEAAGKPKKEARRFMGNDPAAGFVDPSEKFVYVVNSTGKGIQAITIESGKLRWATEDASLPLAIVGDRLYALGAIKGERFAVRLYAFDLYDHEKVGNNPPPLFKSDPITLPENTPFPPANNYDQFAMEADLKDGHMILDWRASHTVPSGIPRPAPLGTDWRGKVDVTLKTGKVKIVEEKTSPAAKRVMGKPVPLLVPATERIPTPVKLSPALKEVFAKLKRSADSYYQPGTTGGWERLTDTSAAPFFPLGKRVAALATQRFDREDPIRQKLMLQTWDPDAGKEFEPQELFKGKALAINARTQDGYVFVFQAIPIERIPEAERGTWCVSLGTGKQTGPISNEHVWVFDVVGERAFYRAKNNKELWCADLKTGKPLWMHQVYQVPFLPPPPVAPGGGPRLPVPPQPGGIPRP